MIVEDEPSVAADLKTALESIGHTVVSMTALGEEAVVEAGRREPDLVLMDIYLAGDLDGIETARRIREQSGRGLPVIFLTAYGSDELVERAKRVKPSGYLLKPSSIDQLRIAIELSLAAMPKGDRRRPSPGEKRRILVMDDEEMVRDVLKMALGRFGYEATLAKEGAEALDRYRQAMASGEPFDLVIVDLEVAFGMNGKEMMRKLREIDPTVKAIAHSGSLNDPAMIDCRKYGFAAALPKPCNLRELRGMMTRMVASPAGHTPAQP